MTATYACLFESEFAVNQTSLTLPVAQQGCTSSCASHPLLSFDGTEIDDQLALISCSRPPLHVCNQPQYLIAKTFHHALFLPLARKLEVVGLNYTDGYWTFANRHGEIIPNAYTDPRQDVFMLGEERINTDTSIRRKWLCLCI